MLSLDRHRQGAGFFFMHRGLEELEADQAGTYEMLLEALNMKHCSCTGAVLDRGVRRAALSLSYGLCTSACFRRWS